MMKFKYIKLNFLLLFIFFLTSSILNVSCIDIKNKKTNIEVIDNNRHYYPIIQGQKLDLMFPIKNTGDNPLIVTDIFTSCGCVVVKGSSVQTIPPGKEGRLLLTYNSDKNVGYVKQYVTLYGNFFGKGFREISFDVHVVPDALYTKDYEELYEEEKQKQGSVKDLVDGQANNKGYYIDNVNIK